MAEAEFRHAIGRFLSGVTVITSRAHGRDFGTTANAVCSVSLDPPTVLVCLNRLSETRAAIVEAQAFAVNILAETQAHLASAFARKGEDKFADRASARGPAEMPLIGGCVASLECTVRSAIVAGTHTVFLGAVHHVAASDERPLAYFRGQLAGLSDLALPSREPSER